MKIIYVNYICEIFPSIYNLIHSTQQTNETE